MQMTPIKSWSICNEKGLVTRLITNSGAITISSWGCEFGDWVGTFAQHAMGGLNSSIVERHIDATENSISCRFDIALPTGYISSTSEDFLLDGVIHRTYSLRSLGESLIGDFVVRHAVPSAEWQKVQIGRHWCTHHNRNRMVQLPEDRIECVSQDIKLISEVIGITKHPAFERVSYARDEIPGRWICHHRLLASKQGSDAFVVRIRNWTTISNSVRFYRLLRYPLWRLAERHSWVRPTIQICGLVRMQPDEKLLIHTRIMACK